MQEEMDEIPAETNGHKTRAREKLHEVGLAAEERAREIGAAAEVRAREIGAAAEERAREAGSKARERVEEEIESRRERIAGRIESAAVALEAQAGQSAGLQRVAGRRVARGMESAAGYLHSHHTDEVARDVEGFFRGHRLRTMIIALAGAFLLLRLLR
jgi:hypothetical protein